MAKLCKCDSGLGNTGRPGGCDKPLTVPKGIFMVQTFDSTGARNFIDTSVEVDGTFVNAKINNVDKSKRWYPLNEIQNFGSERADAVFETAPSGRSSYIKDGERALNFELWDGGIVIQGNIEQARCVDTSFYMLEQGRIIGIDLLEDGKFLHPIRIAKNSLSSRYIFASDTTQEKVSVKFQFDVRENDANLRYVEVNANADLLGYMGLVNIKSTITNITTTGFKAKLTNDFGALNKNGLTGLVIGSFALFNTTTSAAVTITSVVENPEGTYTFAFAAQASGSKLRLTPTSAQYDFSNTVANLVIIP